MNNGTRIYQFVESTHLKKRHYVIHETARVKQQKAYIEFQ